VKLELAPIFTCRSIGWCEAGLHRRDGTMREWLRRALEMATYLLGRSSNRVAFQVGEFSRCKGLHYHKQRRESRG
jgi:hypothetical protein